MLPSILSREVKVGIRRFLESTFPCSTPLFAGSLQRLLDDPGEVFKGPYFSFRLPFKAAANDVLPFAQVAYPYRPFLHQSLAFERLAGEATRSTIIATGTGSGKTECFLYPILDYCYRHPEQKGIRAIILYPMNALATDQAKRFAAAVRQHGPAGNKLQVGMYVGGLGDNATTMTEDWVITDRNTMRKSPPDILLTNYKMLDYLLIRPDDAGLWGDNDPESLKFVVVDELHSFDGAQATDLGCLVRRLKSRLKTPDQHLCCVGTSATIGSLEQSTELLDYADRLFGEPFDREGSIITEHVLTQAEFNHGLYIRYSTIPGREDEAELRPGTYAGHMEYLRGQYRLWFEKEAPADLDNPEWRVELGNQLRQHALLRNLLQYKENLKKEPVSEEEILQELALFNSDLQDHDLAFKVFDSLCSLCAFARHKDSVTGRVSPLLKIHVHLWFRELSRMVASVECGTFAGNHGGQEDDLPKLRFSSELKKVDSQSSLPVIHCRDCGSMGWGALQRPNEEALIGNLDRFYQGFFGNDPKLRFIYPITKGEGSALGEVLCGHCLMVATGQPSRCPGCGHDDRLVPVALHGTSQMRGDRLEADRSCPHCGSPNGITILGSRSASLSSVALGQTFATRFNDDKQTLAFSDNVQDASHRASFFAARTYRTTLRTAMCEALNDLGKTTPTLAEFEKHSVTYWSDKLKEAGFIGTFIAPNMEWLQDYETLYKTGELAEGHGLSTLVAKRLGWEVVAEFGFQARIGRTLEKSSAAVAFFPPALIDAAATRLQAELREKGMGFGAIAVADLSRFILGLLHRLRTMGGIFHEPFGSYFKEQGNTYLLNRENWTPGFAPRGRSPSAYVMGTAPPGNLERVISTGKNPSWLQSWATKTLRIAGGLNVEAATEVIEQALSALTREGILQEDATRIGNRLWLIEKEALHVSAGVTQLCCRGCGHQVAVAAAAIEGWANNYCLRKDCSGTYEAHPQGPDYFGELYRSGNVCRIHSEEHTGLIDREEREWIERRFMATTGRRATDPNLLSCTPTLEMGIDIGALSSVLLCSVPPETSNYLQRVGRAGRRDGNAFSLTVANANPHDLYFYRQPEEMMAGDVKVPGVFLNAPAVLERQFLAFCFDCWIAGTRPVPFIPRKIDPVLKNVLKPAIPPTGFPYDLLYFAQRNRAAILRDFFGLFEGELTEESKESLRHFASGDGSERPPMECKIIARLTLYAQEREDLAKRRKDARNRLTKLKNLPARDEAVEMEMDELERTAKGLSSIIRTIGNTETFQFFTDEGLIPNYAFPEEGVTLRSVILRKKEKKSSNNEGNYRSETFEYKRPAASAIRELAPGSKFYVQGRKLTVDQVNLNLSGPETWNFCDQCGYIERLDTGTALKDACPNCGSFGWADASMRRKMIPMRQVMTTEFDRNSRTHDESDERTPEFFDSETSVVIPPSEIQKAYRVKDSSVPFGFEFVRQATLRNINLGTDAEGGEKTRLAGKERLANGFRLCPKCGKVKGARRKFQHDITCPERDNDGEDKFLEALFLYRELQSEALRVLVPAVGDQENAEIASFVAALQLGLEAHFKGNIDHLGCCMETRPIPDSSYRRTYLVVYDKVPGGTGYLKQLCHSVDELMRVLRLALEKLRDCKCGSEPDSDGCHRCILKNRRRNGGNADPSRATAIQLLEHILGNDGEIEEIASIASIDLNPLIESQLEQRFLEALHSLPNATLKDELIDGKNSFVFTIDEVSWEVLPQVTLDLPAVGPGGTIRPDFIFRPVRPKRSRPIAVYLDGFAYHANEESQNNRVAKDIAQREMLRRTGKWLVWSLTWEDLASATRLDAPRFAHPGLEDEQITRKLSLLKTVSEEVWQKSRDRDTQSSWKLLLHYLATPEESLCSLFAYCTALSIQSPVKTSPETIKESVLKMLDPRSVPEITIATEEGAETIAASFSDREDRWQIFLSSTWEGLRNRSPSKLKVLVRFNDHTNLDKSVFAPAWIGLLRLCNLLQFLPQAYFVTERGLRNGLFADLDYTWDQSPTDTQEKTEASPSEPGWTFDPELVHPDMVPVLQALQSDGVSEPICGYELIGPDESVVGEAELAWPDRKVALLLPDQAVFTPHFKSQEWKVILWADNLEDLQQTLIQNMP